MSRPRKRHLVLKTFVVLCLLGAIGTTIAAIRTPSKGDSVKRQVTAKIDSCKYDAKMSVIDVKYTVSNPSDHTAGATLDLRFVDKAGSPLGVDLVYVPRITPGATVNGVETTRIGKSRTATCEFTLRIA